MRFIDEATITVRSGKGGNGCVSFRREKYLPKGGPDGGDGGKGGDVVLMAADRILSLFDFRLKRLYEARNGDYGMGKDRCGANAEDLILELPVGTQVLEQHEDGTETLLADLTIPGEPVVICKGGDGGRGNIHFKSPTNQAPRRADKGWPGEEKRLRLELKILADVGLLGLPNAGKSTFLAAVSAARPKIAAYPFTTLVPNLGVLHDDEGRRLVIADIPGLIEGASQGQGLGHKVLKHVERTRFLVHLLSVEEIKDDDPFLGFRLLDDELSRFNEELGRKDQIRVVNKIDTLEPAALKALKAKARKAKLPVFFISALRGDGLEELLEEIWRRVIALENAGQAAVQDKAI